MDNFETEFGFGTYRAVFISTLSASLLLRATFVHFDYAHGSSWQSSVSAAQVPASAAPVREATPLSWETQCKIDMVLKLSSARVHSPLGKKIYLLYYPPITGDISDR